MTNTIVMHVGDVRDVMARMIAADDRFDLLVTSPPFLALRSYLPADHPDKHREIGSEPTPAGFLDTMYGLTADCAQLLPLWASICVELGETMSGSGGAGGDYDPAGLRAGQQRYTGSARSSRGTRFDGGASSDYGTGAAARPARAGRRSPPNTSHRLHDDGSMKTPADRRQQEPKNLGQDLPPNGGPGWPLSKSMCLIPHSYTFGLIWGHNPITGTPSPAGQWRARNVVAWARPNPPVGSLGKRNPHKRTGDQKFRPACSFITVACRGAGRYFDLDAVRFGEENVLDQTSRGRNGVKLTDQPRSLAGGKYATRVPSAPGGAPPLDWHVDDLDGDWLWKLATAPYKGAHYATFPLTLPRRLVLAMCPERVCTVCGWPSERITATTNAVGKATRRNRAMADRADDPLVSTDVPDGTERLTVGWTDCGCSTDGSHWRTGRVLDAFGGSGTTAVAAALEGRDAVLIDLDRRNVDLADRRIRESLRVVRQVASHPVPRTDEEGRCGRTPTKRGAQPRPIYTRVTWTVDGPRPVDPKPPKITGQANLLDLLGGST